jgi:hypothetical protein
LIDTDKEVLKQSFGSLGLGYDVEDGWGNADTESGGTQGLVQGLACRPRGLEDKRNAPRMVHDARILARHGRIHTRTMAHFRHGVKRLWRILCRPAGG